MSKKQKVNIETLQVSPLMWYEAIKYSNDMAHDIGKCIDKNSDFERWLNEGTIEHDDIQIANDYIEGISSVHNNQIRNEYTFQLGFIDKYKTKHQCKNIKELESHPLFLGQEIIYIFKVHDLIHFSLYHLQNWLLLDNEFHKKRWVLFMEFLLSQTKGTNRELCKIFWNMLLIRIDLGLKHYAHEEQYKIFTEYNKYLQQESAAVWDKFIRIRDNKGC